MTDISLHHFSEISPFNLFDVGPWDPENPRLRLLDIGLRESGILSPVIALASTPLTLVDGFKRLAFARYHNLAAIPVHLLKPETEVKHLLDLFYWNHHLILESSLIKRLQFLNLARHLGTSHESLTGHFLPLLGLDYHSQLFRHCERILHLPASVLAFCEEKKVGFKYCLNLTHYDPDLLGTLLSWRPAVYLSTSLYFEMTEWIRDIQKNHPLDLATLLKDHALESLLGSTKNPHEKSALLRTYFFAKRFPIVTHQTEQLLALKKNLHFRHPVQVDWDPSLENKRLVLQATVTDEEQILALIDDLSLHQNQEVMSSLLQAL